MEKVTGTATVMGPETARATAKPPWWAHSQHRVVPAPNTRKARPLREGPPGPSSYRSISNQTEDPEPGGASTPHRSDSFSTI
jgi:hypothetical protein